jgi:hypothetical protein
MVQEFDEIVDMRFYCVLSVSHIALTVPPQVVGNRAVRCPDDFKLRVPHHMAEGESVKENDRQSGRIALFHVMHSRVVYGSIHGRIQQYSF